MGNNIVEHTLNKVVFLDRDGTLNEEVNYLHKPEDMKLLPGVPQALKKLKDAGYKLIVVTNQAGVARGYYTEEDVKILHQYMNQLLEKEGAEIDAFYYCPHHPVHGIGAYKKVCNCRKPGTGMFEMAEKDFPVDRAASYMIGDKLLDTEAGQKFGVTSILVGTGYGGGKVTSSGDFVFYGNLKHSSGAVEHLGDNLTGEGAGDDEQIRIDLTKVPDNIQRIAFTVTIYEAESRRQNFGMVNNAFIRIFDEANGQEMLRYDLGEDFSIETAAVFGEVYKNNGEWKFNAIGSGYQGGLAALCANYGVDVE